MTLRPDIPRGPALVVGLARSGRAAALMLASRGSDVIGCDQGEPEDLDELAAAGIEVHTGQPGDSLLNRIAFVVKSPGVHPSAQVIAAARARGIPVIGELELGWRAIPNRFVAVTGTNGKTTTVGLLQAMFDAAGKPAVSAGNIGTPLCSLVGSIEPQVTVITEVSSFQLADATEFRPDVGVLLQVGEDHLDWHGTLTDYRAAKLSMFARQNDADIAIIGPTVSGDVPGDGQIVRAGLELAEKFDLRLRGPHNRENFACAAAAASACGIEMDAVGHAGETFAGLSHRMQEVADVGGVLYVNDSKATNPDAAMVAIESFEGRVHLILGGSLKGGGFSVLRDPVAENCASVWVIGDAAQQIAHDLEGVGPAIVQCGNLDKAVEAAHAAARPGDVVLLSPACASYDQFENYEQRGERFIQAVERLAQKQ